MGGRSPVIYNRAIDRRNKAWLDQKGSDYYPYRWTTTGPLIRPEQVEPLGIEFVRVPFPGKNQTVWGFGTYGDLERFKSWLKESSK